MAVDEENTFGATAVTLARSFIWEAEDMASSLLEEFGPSSHQILIEESQFNRLRARLDRIRATISDAEKREITDESVKLWLSELRDLEYMAVDIVEEFESSYRFHQVTVEIATKDCKDEEISYFPLAPDLSCISRKIVEMNERFDEIASDRQNLRLEEFEGKRREEAAARPPSSSLNDDDHLQGRQQDLDEIIELLLSDNGYSVVLIIGMPGVGKTALAQHVYNHPKVESCFQQRIWLCVYEDFNVTKITRAIVEGITMECCYQRELDDLQKLVVKLLAQQKLLLVLDDVWNVNLEHWESLQKSLRKGGNGCKVILTSSNGNIAKIMSTCITHRLSCLSDDDCWLICESCGLQGRDVDALVYDDAIKRLKGLPIAAKALRVLLRSACREKCTRNYTPDELHHEVMQKVLPVLKRNYDCLPAHLKRCFAYCSLFPLGYIFDKDLLVRLWIAQGFVSSEASRVLDVEVIGRQYFDYLVGMHFFVHSQFYDVSEERYVMHDLFHELASSISGKEIFRIEDYKLQEVHYRTRHTSIAPPKEYSQNKIQLEPFGGQALRTFLFIGKLEYKQVSISALTLSPKIDLMFNVTIAKNFFMHLDCLRALDLRNADIDKLPESIGRLKHLHYLSLENTNVKRLPDSLCNLYKLQILDLKHCYHLEELPHNMKHLSLQHLELPSAGHSIIGLPAGIGELICLKTLPIFPVGSHDAHCKLAELQRLVKLSGELQISGLHNVLNEQDAEDANLKSKEGIQKLTLQWSACWSSDNDSDSVRMAELVLDRLQPHHSLEELNIKYYFGMKISTWLTDPVFSCLAAVNLQDCTKCVELPPFGQLPSLTYLTIKMMNVQCVGDEFCGRDTMVVSFPKLMRLEFEEMYQLEKWYRVKEGDFPSLESLIITSCPKLQNLPQVAALRELRIHSCEQLAYVPVFSSLRYLQMTGINGLKCLQLPNLSVLETLEINCCAQLLSVDLHHLVSLRLFKVKRCPILNFSEEAKLPFTLQVVYADDRLSSHNLWSSLGFQIAEITDWGDVKLVRDMQATSKFKSPILADADCSSARELWCRNVKQAL